MTTTVTIDWGEVLHVGIILVNAWFAGHYLVAFGVTRSRLSLAVGLTNLGSLILRALFP